MGRGGRSAAARRRQEQRRALASRAQAEADAAEVMGPHAMAVTSSASEDAAGEAEEYELIPLDDESEGGSERLEGGNPGEQAVEIAVASGSNMEGEQEASARMEETKEAEAVDSAAATVDGEGLLLELEERSEEQLKAGGGKEREEDADTVVESVEESAAEQDKCGDSTGVGDSADRVDNSSAKSDLKAEPGNVEQEEPIELSFVSDSSVEAAIEAEQQQVKDSVENTPATSDADADSATHSNDSNVPSVSTLQRKRKRNKKMFSSKKYQSHPRVVRSEVMKEEVPKFVPAPIVTEQIVEHVHGKQRHIEHVPDYTTPSPSSESTFLYPSTPPGDAWQWESCEAYFAPLRQYNIEDLERIRRSQANFVAANAQSPFTVKLNDAILDAMLADATDRVGAYVSLNQRRGRYYRDVWEEEDYIDGERRRIMYRDDAVDMTPSVLCSNQDLVFGYDDDCYREYVMRLEDALSKAITTEIKEEDAEHAQLEEAPTPSKSTRASTRRSASSGTSSTRNRSKKPPRQAARSTTVVVAESPLENVLPRYANHNTHPASLGRWRLVKEKEVDYTAIHPAACHRNSGPVRWQEEVEADQLRAEESGAESDAVAVQATSATELSPPGSFSGKIRAENMSLKSFGNSGLEQDEISDAIAASMSKLMSLSELNWRSLQTVHERAAAAQQCASIFEAEATASKALEQLYLSKFCSPLERGDPNSLPPTPSAPSIETKTSRERQPVSLHTRPRDLIALSSRPAITGEDAMVPVAASVEFAMTLRKGDTADVLDCNGCWNEGVVLEVYAENGQYTKFVLVRLSLWSPEVAEWISVTDGRLLPHGVASGRMEFVLSRSQFRDKKLTINRDIANMLEMTFPQRRAKLDELAKKEAQTLSRLVSRDDGSSQKRKRKR